MDNHIKNLNADFIQKGQNSRVLICLSNCLTSNKPLPEQMMAQFSHLDTNNTAVSKNGPRNLPIPVVKVQRSIE